MFALTEDDGVVGTESRMFVPALGIPEDPVSGNAHGMLGVYLVTHGLMTPKDGRVVFRGRQGMWMRRPGVVEVEVESSGKRRAVRAHRRRCGDRLRGGSAGLAAQRPFAPHLQHVPHRRHDVLDIVHGHDDLRSAAREPFDLASTRSRTSPSSPVHGSSSSSSSGSFTIARAISASRIWP